MLEIYERVPIYLNGIALYPTKLQFKLLSTLSHSNGIMSSRVLCTIVYGDYDLMRLQGLYSLIKRTNAFLGAKYIVHYGCHGYVLQKFLPVPNENNESLMNH